MLVGAVCLVGNAGGAGCWVVDEAVFTDWPERQASMWVIGEWEWDRIAGGLGVAFEDGPDGFFGFAVDVAFAEEADDEAAVEACGSEVVAE